MARTLSLRQLFAACFVVAALVLVSDDRQSFVQVSRTPNGIAERQLRDAMKQENTMATVGSEQPQLTAVSGNWVSASLPFVVSVMMGMLVAFGGVGAANAEGAEVVPGSETATYAPAPAEASTPAPVATAAPVVAASPAPEAAKPAPAVTAPAPAASTPAPVATAAPVVVASPAAEAAKPAPAATAPAPAASTPAPVATAAPVAAASTDSLERAKAEDKERAARVRVEDSRERAVELDKERAMRARMSPRAGTMSEADILRAEANVFDKARAARVTEAGKVTGAQSSETDQARARAGALDLERAARKQAASGDFPKPPKFNAAREAVAESQKAYYKEAIGKAAEAELANRAKVAAERDDKLNASAASSAITGLQQQETMFTEKLKVTKTNQLITEVRKENKMNWNGYPTKPVVSPDALPVDVFASSLLAVGAAGIAQDIIIKGKQAKEQNQEDGRSLV